jgi:hypothetical protein
MYKLAKSKMQRASCLVGSVVFPVTLGVLIPQDRVIPNASFNQRLLALSAQKELFTGAG